jgi:hypothetical protein
MKATKNYFVFIFCIFSSAIFCQQTTEESKSKIATILNNYFDLEREAIHLHLDKTTFINCEAIWYQGYIINRKTNMPYFTTNVYVLLWDEKGNQLSEKLIYATNGTFSGKIDLGPKLDSGNYYIQVYTNWMNNFSENESTITKIQVINPSQGIKNYKKINPETLEISINPEGRNYIYGISNQIGIHLKDCRGNAPENIEATLENNEGEILKTFKLNTFGYGKFEVIPKEGNLKVVVNYEGKRIEKQMPIPENFGYTLEVNSFTMEGKTIVKIKTNSTTSNLMQNNKLYLLVHQDQKYVLFEIMNDKNLLEQIIFINNSDLSEGINSIRILDSKMKQWAERLIYMYPKVENSISILKNGSKGDQINLVGYSPYPNASLSVSVLPTETKSWDDSDNIISGITINPYLNDPIENGNYYFNSLGRAKYYALDLFLINQEKQKYEWELMKTTTPSTNYSFDIGLSLKGTIDKDITNKPYHKVKLISYQDLILMKSDVSEEGDYHFEHILIPDSTSLNITLQKLPDFKKIQNTFTPQLINRKKIFYKPFKINIPEYCPSVENIDITSLDVPKFSSKSILLDEVKVINDKKKLIYEKMLGNSNLRAFKIDERMQYQILLNFIQNNGFNVVKDLGNVTVYARNRTTVNSAPATPQISIDERVLMTHNELDMMLMEEIDEIYLSPYAIVPSFNNFQGVIKIYTKKIPPKRLKKQDTDLIYIQNAFAHNINFKNVIYDSIQNEGFYNYGIIHWTPRLTSDESGQYLFEIPNYNRSYGKIIIEGMTPEGKLFHEEKTIDLK